VQNFRAQFTAIRQVCEQLGLTLGQSKQGARAVLNREGVTNKVAEEFFAILFMYMAD